MIRFQQSKNLRVGILKKPYLYSANVCNTLYYNLCRCKWWNTSALKGYIIGQGVISEQRFVHQWQIWSNFQAQCTMKTCFKGVQQIPIDHK